MCGVIFSNRLNLRVLVVSIICLFISWNIYPINITLLLLLFVILNNKVMFITNKCCGIIGYVDTLASSNHAQLVFHYVFSF